MTGIPTFGLAALFLIAAAAVWVAGAPLARTTAALSRRYGLGEALGGMLILAIVTDLPEVAIVASAALRGELDVAVGNLLGGVAMQMLVLVVLDRALPRAAPLATRAASPSLRLECALVVVLLAVAAAGPALASLGTVGPLSLPDLLVPALWLGGLLWLGRHRPHSAGQREEGPSPPWRGARTVLVFAAAALVTFAGGWALEVTGDALAQRFGMGGVLFGATVLAAVTSLPELSTGWAAVRAGEDELAVSDILGGNAVLPVLLTPATLLAGSTAYAVVDGTSRTFAVLGIAVTLVYLAAALLRSSRRILGLGWEGLAMMAVYALGLALLALSA